MSFWKDYASQIVDLTKRSKRDCVMSALWGLNKSLLDLYQAKAATVPRDLSRDQRSVVNRYCGYVLHYVVLVNFIVNKGIFEPLIFAFDDLTVVDPVDKVALLNIATTLSGLATEYSYERDYSSAYASYSDRFIWTSRAETDSMVMTTLNRILRFLASNTDQTLQDLATQHIDIFYGRDLTPAAL